MEADQCETGRNLSATREELQAHLCMQKPDKLTRDCRETETEKRSNVKEWKRESMSLESYGCSARMYSAYIQ